MEWDRRRVGWTVDEKGRDTARRGEWSGTVGERE